MIWIHINSHTCIFASSQGLEVPRKADEKFEANIAKAITSRNLQAEDSFILKVLPYYDTRLTVILPCSSLDLTTILLFQRV